MKLKVGFHGPCGSLPTQNGHNRRSEIMFVQILQIIVIMGEMKTQQCTSSAVYPMTQIT